MKVFLNSDACCRFTKETGIDTVPLKEYGKIPQTVSSHADMLINIIEGNVFCYGDYYEENKDIFGVAEQRGYKIIKCTPPISKEYPYDIGLNALVMGKRIFGKVKYLSAELKEYAEGAGYRLINVNQGYAACSTLVLDDNNAVTADTSIKKALEREGIRVTLIGEGSIALPGYNYGFIGGASLVINGKIYVFGNAKMLTDYGKIKAHADSLMMDIISISSGDVVDFGGGRVIF